MKGIILAGGHGTRLQPLTLAISKQLLPVYNKPLIYYPLTTLMLAGIRDFLLISTPNHLSLFQSLLGNGSELGINIEYATQLNPSGIPDAFNIAKNFIGEEPISLILGDNFFYGPGIGRSLKESINPTGAKIFLKEVNNPEEFGVLFFDKTSKPIAIEEKPINPNSNLAVTGIYFYNNSVCEYVKFLKVSKRNELEISDLNMLYLSNNTLEYEILPRSTVWLDTGTFDGLHDASEFVRVIEKQQGIRVGDPLEVAVNNGWIK